MTDEYAVGRMILSRGKLKHSDKNLLQCHSDITDPTQTSAVRSREPTTKDMAQTPLTVNKAFADKQKIIICCMWYIKTLTFLLQNYTSNSYPQVFTASVSYMILAFGNKACRTPNISFQLGEQCSCHLQGRCLCGDSEVLIQIRQYVVWERWRCERTKQRSWVLSSKERPCGDAKSLATCVYTKEKKQQKRLQIKLTLY